MEYPILHVTWFVSELPESKKTNIWLGQLKYSASTKNRITSAGFIFST